MSLAIDEAMTEARHLIESNGMTNSRGYESIQDIYLVLSHTILSHENTQHSMNRHTFNHINREEE